MKKNKDELKKMSIEEWNEFVRNNKWVIAEELPTPDEMEELRAAINNLDD